MFRHIHHHGKRSLKFAHHHGKRAIKSKYGKIIIVLWFIPEALALFGVLWALIKHFPLHW
jgi:hypothetical protein